MQISGSMQISSDKTEAFTPHEISVQMASSFMQRTILLLWRAS